MATIVVVGGEVGASFYMLHVAYHGPAAAGVHVSSQAGGTTLLIKGFSQTLTQTGGVGVDRKRG